MRTFDLHLTVNEKHLLRKNFYKVTPYQFERLRTIFKEIAEHQYLPDVMHSEEQLLSTIFRLDKETKEVIQRNFKAFFVNLPTGHYISKMVFHYIVSHEQEYQSTYIYTPKELTNHAR